MEVSYSRMYNHRANIASRGHLAKDILPYVCIFKACKTPDEMYATTEELVKHMKQENGVARYVCDHCKLKPDEMMVFDDAEDWEAHMQSTHFYNLPPAQLSLLADMNLRTMIAPISCPLCSYSTEVAQPDIPEHIADHSHRFALRSLPWGTSDDEKESDSSDRKIGIKSEVDPSTVEDMEGLEDPNYPEIKSTQSMVDFYNSILGPAHSNFDPDTLDLKIRESMDRVYSSLSLELSVETLELCVPFLLKMERGLTQITKKNEDTEPFIQDMYEQLLEEAEALRELQNREGSDADPSIGRQIQFTPIYLGTYSGF
jgi:quinol monooxygenase YgiN